MEEWRDIENYEGYYQVSTLGRIKSLKRLDNRNHTQGGKILHPTLNGGYYRVSLCKNGIVKPAIIHQVVATTFLGPCPVGQQIRHGSNGKADNSVVNLSYGTASDDCFDRRRDGTHGGRPVRRSDGKEYINMSIAAEDIGCHPGNIYHTCRGDQKTACGWGFEFMDTVMKKAPRPVRRTDGEEFVSVCAGAKATGCDASTLAKVCKGQRKTAGGYGWEYI